MLEHDGDDTVLFEGLFIDLGLIYLLWLRVATNITTEVDGDDELQLSALSHKYT